MRKIWEKRNRKALNAAFCLSVAAFLVPLNASAISHGQPTSVWPGMGALQTNGGDASDLCGALLISPHWVMTAAFCVSFGNQFTFAISTDLNSTDPGSIVVYTPDLLVIDPDYSLYNPPPVLHDVALLHFATAIPAMPFRINDNPEAYQPSTPVWVVGFGYDDQNAINEHGGRKEIAEYVQGNGAQDIFLESGVPITNGPCQWDFGDSWSLLNKDGFPLIVGIVTAMTAYNCGGLAYAIPTVDEINFISSHVADACLTSTIGPPCEGIFRNDFGIGYDLGDPTQTD